MPVIVLVPQPSHSPTAFEEQDHCPSGDPLRGRLDTHNFVICTLSLRLGYGFFLGSLPGTTFSQGWREEV